MHAPLRRPVRRPARRPRRLTALAAVAALAAPLLLTATAAATPSPSADRHKGAELARKLVHRTGADGAGKHLTALQRIAEENGGNRAAGTAGHLKSARYAGDLLEEAGYEVTYQQFEFTYRETLAERLTVRSPEQRDIPVNLMTYTASTPEGGTEAAVAQVPVDSDGSTGCEADDYRSGTFEGRIALIRRGGCTFAEKQAAAADAGAVGAVVYNNTAGELQGTLEKPGVARIPTGGISGEDGEKLSALIAGGEVTVDLELRELQEQRTTPNVLAETPGGDPDNVVMLGAHLDSVADGAGLNDNGSGSAGILETALRFADTSRMGRPGPQPPNKVRFALWTGEEVGLQGSEHYVTGLSPADRDRIALYLNFDMIASPNYGLFVYDGDDSDGVGAGPGPEGSAELERDITAFLTSRDQVSRGTDFTGRSDYGPFIDVGIPSGGTFTGAEGLKTAEEAQLWGGEAGTAYDSCYHRACDGPGNIDEEAFDVNVKVIANAVGRYAWDTSGVPGNP